MALNHEQKLAGNRIIKRLLSILSVTALSGISGDADKLLLAAKVVHIWILFSLNCTYYTNLRF